MIVSRAVTLYKLHLPEAGRGRNWPVFRSRVHNADRHHTRRVLGEDVRDEE